VTLRHGAAQALAPVGPGEGVLPAGGDAEGGAVLLAAGTRLRRLQVSLLVAAGITRVQVRAPRLALVRARTGGDTAIDAALDLVAGDIGAAGGIAIVREAALADALQDEAVDVVVAIGGTGAGRNDTSVTTLARLGQVGVHGIALAPGETAAFGLVGPRPVLLLPGRLDAALAAWLVLGRRLMARLCGGASEEAPAAKAKLGRKVTSALGLAELVPVRLRDGTAEPIASGYVPFSALARADGWILVPAESEGYPPGAEVMVRPWP
jgi:molybdopterin molybdotransferase